MISILLLASLLFLSPSLGHAENLGVYGTLYPIVEPDLLAGIHAKLRDWQLSGEMVQQTKRFKEVVRQHSLRPQAVTEVSDLGQLTPASYQFDPTVTVQHDIVTMNHTVIAQAGTQLNPLHAQPFSETLVFFNGDNKNQLQRIKKLLNQPNRPRYKFILVKGDIRRTEKFLQHRVYFDQAGVLCHYFGIQHTISLVHQALNKGVRQPWLVIQEVRSV